MFFIYLIAFLTFFQTAISASIIQQFAFFDEVVTLFCCIYLLFKKIESKQLKRLRLLLGFVAVSLLLSSFNSFGLRPSWMIVAQTVIHLKFFIFLLFFLVWCEKKDPSNVIHALVVLSALGLLLNLALGSILNEILNVKTQFRHGVVRPVGFQGDTGNLGSMAAFSFIFYMFRTGNVTIARFSIYTMVMMVFSVLSSVRTPFLSVALSSVGAFVKSPKLILIGAALTGLGVFIGSFLGLEDLIQKNWEITVANFDWLDDPIASAYIRGIMIFFAFSLSYEYFPFGTGAASYGTVFSEGSWVYEQIGLANSRFFLETEGIYDSNFSSILGEFGYLGLFLYILLFYKFYRYFVSISTGVRVGVVTFFALLAGYSLVNPIFMNSYSAILYPLMLVALVNGFKAHEVK